MIYLVTTKVSFGISFIEQVSIMQRLVNISNDVHKIPGHECSLKGDAISVCFEHTSAEVDDFEGIDV